MGKMKDLFIGIQLALEARDYSQLLTELENIQPEHRAEMLLDVVMTLASWEEADNV